MEKEGLSLEAMRQDVVLKVKKALEKEKSFNGKKYGALDLQPPALAEWKDRPVIDETKEPLRIRDSVRIILIEDE